jgi:hypothetical protein
MGEHSTLYRSHMAAGTRPPTPVERRHRQRRLRLRSRATGELGGYQLGYRTDIDIRPAH